MENYFLTANYMLRYLAMHGRPRSTFFFNSSHQHIPLHTAAEAGHGDIVRYFYDKGTNINIKDEDGVSE